MTGNHGDAIYLIQETIESEGINHFAPGSAVLSCGSMRSMLFCDDRYSWSALQFNRFLNPGTLDLTPEVAVETALRRRLTAICYRDAAIWHEWVMDTAGLARKSGLANLYKSALYLTGEAIEELTQRIDAFSVQLRSMDPQYHTKVMSSRIEPVLEGIKQVYEAGRHIEISFLMAPGVSDDETSARRIAHWLLAELNPSVPLHFVLFQPGPAVRNTITPSLRRLERAREIAMEMGVEHVYLGNVPGAQHNDTYCAGCGSKLVSRNDAAAHVNGLDKMGCCSRCGRDAYLEIPRAPARKMNVLAFEPKGHRYIRD